MLTKIDKAWVSALVGFVSLTAMQFWGYEIPPTVQAGVVSAAVFAMTWLVPNKT